MKTMKTTKKERSRKGIVDNAVAGSYDYYSRAIVVKTSMESYSEACLKAYVDGILVETRTVEDPLVILGTDELENQILDVRDELVWHYLSNKFGAIVNPIENV